MRKLSCISVAVVLGGCAGTPNDVAKQLAAGYEGQNVDQMVLKFGPPSRTFTMNSGQQVYEWHLGSITNIDTGDYGGTAQTFSCKVQAITTSHGIVSGVQTVDATNMLNESLCAQRLGIKRQKA